MSIEPNDIISDANDSNVSSDGVRSTTINGSINPDNDVDLYQFQANSGEGIILDIDSAIFSSGLDSVLRLFDANGNELAFDDDTPAPGEEFTVDSYLTFVTDTSGDYYVGVSSFSNFDYDPFNSNSGSGGSSGDYDLEISLVEVEDVEDPDDTIPEAIATNLDNVGESATFNGVIETSSDVDFYQVQLDSGEGIILDIDAEELGFGLDSQLRFFDESGNELASNSSNRGPGEDFSSDPFIPFVAESSGDYYIGVSSDGNFDYDPFNPRTNLSQGSGFSTGDYELNIDILEVTPDDDPDNTISEAVDTNVSSSGQNSTVIQDSISPESDADVYKFQLDEGDSVALNINASELDTGLDPILRLFDESGNELAVNDDNQAPGEDFSLDSYIEFTAPATGEYYVGVSGFSDFNYDVVNGRTNFDEFNENSFSTGDYELVIDAFNNTEGTDNLDLLVGDGGNDSIQGLSGNDILTGLGQNDSLNGGAGNDILTGNNGNDTLIGGAGDDILTGNAGNDVLQGDGGTNSYYGNSGADVFVVSDIDEADNTIYDFEDGTDKILIQGASFFSVTLDEFNSGFGTSISVFGNTVAQVIGINPDDLSEDDFVS